MSLFVVGTGRDPGLERMISFLCDEYKLPITVVSFQVFESPTGARLLARELSEPDVARHAQITQRRSVEDICQLADGEGIGEPYRNILQAAQGVGLYARPYKHSIMYTPPNNRNRMLFTAWAQVRDGGVVFYSDSKAFAEFYPIPAQTVLGLLGPDAWRSLTQEDVVTFTVGLKRAFEIIESQAPATAGASDD
jgi:hypothetical protein